MRLMDFLLRLSRHLVRFILGAVMVLCGLYFAWMAAVLFFLLTGRLRQGEMFHDLQAPTVGDALIGLALTGAVVAACAVMRRRIGVQKELPPA
jgi:hypothetical protein